MRSFTVVTRASAEPLPAELALLEAPVRTEEPSAPGEYVGRTEGVMLDEAGDVVAFVVRLQPPFAGHRPPWTLVPASALTIDGTTLVASWTEDQLLAQPRLDASFHPHERVAGGLPVESTWMPARPNVVPPGSGVNKREAAVEGAAGGVLGAAVGALAGLVVAGPLGAAALGVFFAAGGSLAGLIAGGSQETAVQAGELDVETSRDKPAAATSADLEQLAEELRRPGRIAAAGLHATKFDLVSSDETAQQMTGTG